MITYKTPLNRYVLGLLLLAIVIVGLLDRAQTTVLTKTQLPSTTAFTDSAQTFTATQTINAASASDGLDLQPGTVSSGQQSYALSITASGLGVVKIGNANIGGSLYSNMWVGQNKSILFGNFNTESLPAINGDGTNLLIGFFSSTGGDINVTLGGTSAGKRFAWFDNNSTLLGYVDDKGTFNSQGTVTDTGGVGSWEYQTLQKTFRFNDTMGWNGLVGVFYANTADSSAVVNTATETNFDTNYLIPANALTAGKSIRVWLWGRYSTTSSPTLTLKLKLGTASLGSSGALTTGTSATDIPFVVLGMFTCRTTGTNGTADGHIRAELDGTGLTVFPAGIGRSGTVAINTTVAASLAVSATWSAASPSNSVTVDSVTMEALN